MKYNQSHSFMYALMTGRAMAIGAVRAPRKPLGGAERTAMGTIKRTVEVEATYLVVTYWSDGNTGKEQIDDDHEACLLAVLRSAEEGVIMVKVFTMYSLAGEPVSELQMIALDGAPWFRENDETTLVENAVVIAEHGVMYNNMEVTPLEFIIDVAAKNDLSHVLPADVLATGRIE